MPTVTLYRSPIGVFHITCGAKKIHRLQWMNTHHDVIDEGAQTLVTRCVISWLNSYFSGDRPVPLAENLFCWDDVSVFTSTVLKQVRHIPYGSVVSYKTVAEETETGARAVGGALSRNPFPILIPCHRIISSHTNSHAKKHNHLCLKGYLGAEGVAKKKYLLALENPQLFID